MQMEEKTTIEEIKAAIEGGATMEANSIISEKKAAELIGETVKSLRSLHKHLKGPSRTIIGKETCYKYKNLVSYMNRRNIKTGLTFPS